jgi:hypothetical protein
MIRPVSQWLNRWAAKRLASISDQTRAGEREHIKAKARAMREAMGMPEADALR